MRQLPQRPWHDTRGPRRRSRCLGRALCVTCAFPPPASPHRCRPQPKYDTAGSAKYIRDEGLEGCAAIASDLAAELYGLSVVEANIEDDDVNYTRFLLLSRQPVSNLIPPDMDAKMSIVFLVESKPGMLYRAMACFALRDIDLTKCESRPTSVQLLQYLQVNFPSWTLNSVLVAPPDYTYNRVLAPGGHSTPMGPKRRASTPVSDTASISTSRHRRLKRIPRCETTQPERF